MENKKIKLAIPAIVIFAVVLQTTFFEKTNQAWAIEQTIETLKKYKGACLTGICPTKKNVLVGFEMWFRTNDTGISSTDALIKLDDGVMQWTKDNSTYTYIPGQNTIEYEDAVTLGISHWLGPELFKLLTTLKDSKTTYGNDPATGRKLAILSASLTDAAGQKSFQVDFDVETKLPVSLKTWDNLRRKGRPTFSATKIRYFEQLSDDTFAVQIPADAKYVKKPIMIPEANLEILSNSKYGISAEGLTKEQACRIILEKLFNAVIEGDLKLIRNLVPVSRSWSTESLKNLLRIGQDDEIIEVLKIGNISKESSTRLGPIVVVPVLTKRKNETIWQDKFVIQFRNIAEKTSCVVHGPYGLPVQLE
ncbi:MAG: hypothetical protein GY845_28510 [Planctomycetes bacterium]|nr:hypothetical protein [Planctomycetota bacterium]